MNKEELAYDFIQTFNVSLYYYESLDQYTFNAIEAIKNDIVEKVFNEVIHYCQQNNVYMQDFDDYKIVYFIGLKAYEITNNKKILLDMITILNALVMSDSKVSVNEDMLKKMAKSIDNNKWKEFYGIYGIYSIFKSCSKHLA